LKIIITDNVETVLNLHHRYPGLVLDLRARRDGHIQTLDGEPDYFWVETQADKIVARRLLSTIAWEMVYIIGSEEQWAEIQTGEFQEQTC